jgi:hypothetical protein
MTSKEFVIWLQGFTQGIEEYNITPTPLQWNVIKGKLAEVNDEPSYNRHPPYVDGKGHPNPYYFTTTTNPIGLATFTTTANAEPTQTSERQLLTDNHD